MKYAPYARRILLKMYRSRIGLRRFLIADYWRLKLHLPPKDRG